MIEADALALPTVVCHLDLLLLVEQFASIVIGVVSLTVSQVAVPAILVDCALSASGLAPVHDLLGFEAPLQVFLTQTVVVEVRHALATLIVVDVR